MDIKNCMFCEKGSEEGDLHQILTFDADVGIREMVTELQDTQLLAQIGTADLIVKEAKYHLINKEIDTEVIRERTKNKKL